MGGFIYVDLVKMLHVTVGVVFLGLTIAQYFYIINNIHQKKPILFFYSLRFSFFADGLIALLIIFLLISAASLTKNMHISTLPLWITVAYWLFSLIMLLWIINLGLKIHYYRQFKQGRQSTSPRLIFHFSHSIMLILFTLIIHDAVNRSTFLTFFN